MIGGRARSAPAPDDDGLGLALLGHDLRAALSEMRVGLHFLNGLGLPDQVREPVERCRAVGEHLSRLIDQSIMACLGEAPPGMTSPARVDTAGFLDSLRQRWTSLAAETGHRFVLVAAGDLPESFFIDRTALERALKNLVGNALTHAPPGPVTLTFKISGGDLLLIAVEDDGPGFPSAHLGAIERDFTLPPEARRPGGGLGLQSVRHLIAAMGGRCSARNKLTGGAEVRICLPLATSPAAWHDDLRPAVQAPLLALPPDLSGTRLLLADDSGSTRELVGALAQSIGATIDSVDNGRAAIDRLRCAPLPDVLILDDEMPGATGVEVLTWLRAQGGRLGELPVLALTSHISAHEIARLTRAGATEILSKPVLCPLELGRALRRAQRQDTVATPAGCPVRHDEWQALQRLVQLAGPDAAPDLLQRLQEDLSAAGRGLSVAATGDDLPAIRAHSHVVIALAGTAGCTALHEKAVALNGMAHDRQPMDRIAALALGLEADIVGLVDRVGRLARQLTGAAGTDSP